MIRPWWRRSNRCSHRSVSRKRALVDGEKEEASILLHVFAEAAQLVEGSYDSRAERVRENPPSYNAISTGGDAFAVDIRYAAQGGHVQKEGILGAMGRQGRPGRLLLQAHFMVAP